MSTLTRILIACCCVLASSVGLANARTAPGVTSVTLRATVRLAPGSDATLGQIAQIEGDQADALADLPITGLRFEHGSWTDLTADSVRELIEASPAHAGSVVVIGQSSSVTRMRLVEPIQTVEQQAQEPAPTVVTVRDHIESWLRGRFRVGSDHIRVRFDDRDRPLLDIPSAGRSVSVSETGYSGQIALRVEVFEDQTIVESASLRVGIETLSEGLIVARPVRRGSPLRASDVRPQPVWSDPTDPPASPTLAIGQALIRSLQPGQVVREHHLEAPVMIERGQDVSVRTVHGSVVINTIARARESGTTGELIELEAKDGSRRRFTARVAGKGLAVMSDSESTTPESETGPVSSDAPTSSAPQIAQTPSPSHTNRRDVDLRPINQDRLDLKPIGRTR